MESQYEAVSKEVKRVRDERRSGKTTATPDETVLKDAVAFLESRKDSGVFAKKRPGSAATYAQSFELLKQEHNPTLKLGQIKLLLEDLKDEPTGGRRRTRRRRVTRKRTSQKK